MPGAPRAASAWPSESPGCAGRLGWDKRQRLLRPSEFASFSSAQPGWRAARRWIAMSAQWFSDDNRSVAEAAPAHDAAAGTNSIRFGITVSRRQARRAVARNLVRRIVREAARCAAPRLEAALGGAGQGPRSAAGGSGRHPIRVDVLVRLRSPLPAASVSSWSTMKADLRQEADALLEELRVQLARARVAGG
jgi:ribonuclease P protein component